MLLLLLLLVVLLQILRGGPFLDLFGLFRLGFRWCFLSNVDSLSHSCHGCSGSYNVSLKVLCCFSCCFWTFFFQFFLPCRLGRTLWGSTISYYSNSRNSFTSSTVIPALCFVSMALLEKTPLQCSYLSLCLSSVSAYVCVSFCFQC